MTKEMILDLISQGEGVTIEFKECKNEVAAEAMTKALSDLGYNAFCYQQMD